MPTVSGCGADDLGEALFNKLKDDITLPNVDFNNPKYEIPPFENKEIPSLTNADLTTTKVGGTGTFDVLMTTNRNHIWDEYDQGRITGEQYTRAYIELTTAALGSSIQFLLGRDQAYWQSVIAQQQVEQGKIAIVNANIQLEIAKTQLALTRAQVEKMQSDVVVSKMQISGLDVDYCIKSENKKQAEFVTTTLQPAQADLIREQVEVQRAQTSNTRTDGTVVTGQVGKQKELYDQQIASYKRDSEYKVAKMFLDSWITQKTLDEALLVPNNFKNAEIDEVFAQLRRNVQLQANDVAT